MRLFLTFFILNFSYVAFAQDSYLLVGTYTGTGSKGIYVYRFNSSRGNVVPVSNTDSLTNPSFLAVSTDNRNVYAVNETNHATPGSITAFSFNMHSGKLKYMNSEPTGGDDPCHVVLTNNKKWAIVSNYSGGSVSVLPVLKDGSIGRYVQLIQDSGKSINTDRQEMAHVHEAVLSSDQKFLFTPDLGTDKVMEYSFTNSQKYPLKPAAQKFVQLTPGSGPRHITFSGNNKFAYVIQEMSGSISVYRYNAGHLKYLQNIATHPASFKGAPGSAEIMVSPDNKFLYASNRGSENNIAIFSIDPKSGLLKLIDISPSGGTAPRNFIIDQTGKYLIVANQDSDNIVIFKRDKETGKISSTGNEIKVPKPVCLQLIKIKS